jgi:hypothetical protein
LIKQDVFVEEAMEEVREELKGREKQQQHGRKD